MRRPQTPSELAVWAPEVGLEVTLKRPWSEIQPELDLDPEDDEVWAELGRRAAPSSFLAALAKPGADVLFLNLLPARQDRRAVVDALVSALEQHGDYEGELDDLEHEALQQDPLPPPPAPRGDPLALAVHRGSPRPLPAPSSVAIEAPPQQLGPLQRWAERHGVSGRLHDRAIVLHQVLYAADAWTRSALERCTIGELFALPDPVRPKATGRARRWEASLPSGKQGLLRAACTHLHELAKVRAVVVAHRHELARRAVSPTEPALAALDGRVRAARAEVAAQVQERELGTFLPSIAAVGEAPLSIEYTEAVHFRLGFGGATVSIAIEDEALRAHCSCEARDGRCVHVLSAYDAALDLIADPTNPGRAKLATTLGVPAWRRFLHAFGQELARRQVPAAEEERVVWRVDPHHRGDVAIVPLIQKRLKSGGFSSGQAVEPERLAYRRDLLTDPHDVRVLRAARELARSSYGYPEQGRAQVVAALETLIGHPRVVLGRRNRPCSRIARERLRVSVEPDADGVSVVFSIGPRTYTAASLRAHARGGEDLLIVDEEAGAILLGTLDDRAQALLAAFENHPARFPPQSHDELLRGLSTLQDSVDLVLPDALAGEPVEADARPVLRLTLVEPADLEVDVWVRPVEGGPTLRPTEGAETILHTVDGRRLAARRDRERERALVDAALERLAPGRAQGAAAGAQVAPWTFVLGEDQALDLLAALREEGDRVVVEWPDPGKRLAITGKALRKELRVRVTDRRDWFGVDGEVDVDGTAVPFAVLLEAIRKGRRYVRVGPGKFAEIEDELRSRMAAADDVLHPGRQGLEVAMAGVEQIADLVEDPSYLEAASRWRRLRARIDAARALDPVVPPTLEATLRPYQVEGFKWLSRLAAWGTGACLADDMGLGKTVQTLALLLERAERGPALVIAPTSVGPNWIREAQRFAPGLRARLHRGADRAAALAEATAGDLFVTSYALAVRDAEALSAVRFATLVIDEAQAIKNALTRRARAVRDLDAELRVALTGTPVENHLGELWSLMRVVAPGLLGSWEHFRERFAARIERDHDRERSAALARLVRPFLLRRTKAEVAPELPPRIEMERFVDLSPAERYLYDQARREALESIAGAPGDARFALLAALTRLRRLACHPRLLDADSRVPSSKLAAMIEVVRELRDEGHRALVFSQFTTHLALVREALDAAGVSYEYLDGATPSEERSRRVDAFQAGRSDLFLISLKAGGTGLNLTAATYVIHLDPWWNPAVEDQATDRAHRIGQTRAVTVIRLVARGTIEEAVLALHGQKRALAATVFDEEGGAAQLSAEDLAGLIRAGGAESAGDEESDVAGEEILSADDGGTGAASVPPRGKVAQAQAPKAARGGPPVVPRELAPPVPREPPALPGTALEATPIEPSPTEHAAVPLAAAEAPPPSVDIASALIEHLAAKRGIADARYDATLRAYGRTLRRFGEFLGAHPELEVRSSEGTERAAEAYLAALSSGDWGAPPSERTVARTVMNHLKAFSRTPVGGVRGS